MSAAASSAPAHNQETQGQTASTPEAVQQSATVQKTQKKTASEVLKILKRSANDDEQMDAVESMEVTDKDKKNKKLKSWLLKEAVNDDIEHGIKVKFGDAENDNEEKDEQPEEQTAETKGRKNEKKEGGQKKEKGAEKKEGDKENGKKDQKDDDKKKNDEGDKGDKKDGDKPHKEEKGGHAHGHGFHATHYIKGESLKETGTSTWKGLKSFGKMFLAPFALARYANSFIPWTEMKDATVRGAKTAGRFAKKAVTTPFLALWYLGKAGFEKAVEGGKKVHKWYKQAGGDEGEIKLAPKVGESNAAAHH